jgi:hypothetical protein
MIDDDEPRREDYEDYEDASPNVLHRALAVRDSGPRASKRT